MSAMDDHSTDGDRMMDANLCRRMNGMDDLSDLMMDVSLVAKNLALIRVNRDRMNRGHLQCDHRMSRYRGMSLSLGAKNLGVMNLDVRMNFLHVNQMKGGKMKMMKGDH
jgi:hypothetical protein